VRAVQDAGVASVVFFTARFQPDVRAWLADVVAPGRWADGNAVWLRIGARRRQPVRYAVAARQGALWDLAPHVVSLLWACLGPVVAVTADAGRAT